MTIEKTHHAQNPVNVVILNYVAELDQASYQALFDKFADLQTSEVKAHARFSKKMEYLCFTRQLSSTGRGHDRVFSLGPEAGKAGHSRGFASNYAAHVARVRSQAAAKAAAAADAELVARAIERQASQVDHRRPATANSINVMHPDYPTYQQPRHPALRPGALDYQRVASRGNRC